MTLTRMTVDKLGIRLYDKVSNVVAELVANGYDADAENIEVVIPLDSWFATKSGDTVTDLGLEISVSDDGHGLTRNLVNDTYLKVGSNPRTDPNRGAVSKEKHRPIMGHKGIGKLAPFGICKIIEVKSAGGPKTSKGYQVTNFIMNYDEVLEESDKPYFPTVGKDDGTFEKERGTTVLLRNFWRKRTPDTETFHRQLSRIFGSRLPDFRIKVRDKKTNTNFVVGDLQIEIDPDTKIVLNKRPVPLPDGSSLPVRGWVAYAMNPYKNEEIAGVRIYARGKLIASTRDFGLEAGFHGEYSVRSYLAGEIQADWLDDEEDLVHTGRQDIIWDSERGLALRDWGQSLIRELGKSSLPHTREKVYQSFLEKSKIEEKARELYGESPVLESAKALAKAFGQIADRESVEHNPEYVQKLTDIVLTVAPHTALVEKLTDVAQSPLTTPLEAIVSLFNDSRLAEDASMGQIARNRINSIEKLGTLTKARTAVGELELQALLESVPWLIDSEWTILQANRPFEELRKAYSTWYKKKHGKELVTSAAAKNPTKKPDFIMLPISGFVEIVEIKKQGHTFQDREFDSITLYRETMLDFLEQNPDFKAEFHGVHVTLICDAVRLSRTHRIAYNSLEKDRELRKRTWLEILKATRKAHEDFLARWEEIRKLATGKES